MSRLAPSEGLYRIVDALYRLHDQAYSLEFAVERAMHAGITLAKLRINTAMGAAVAGLLAVVPILTSLGNITVTSAPAMAVYVLAGGLVLLWAYQIHDAVQTQKRLGELSRVDATTPYERDDYLLERVNAWVVRYRLIDQILVEFEQTVEDTTTSPVDRDWARQRIERYQEIRAACHAEIKRVVDVSAQALAAKRRTQEQHDTIRDWAAGLPSDEAPPVPDKAEPA